MSSVLITGASKGIGFETALAFARAGYTVYATMRDPSRSPQLEQIAAREKLPIMVSAMDVDSDESVREGIGRIQNEHGPIDVLVNNAGIVEVGSVEELPLADFRGVMETNYFGALRCIQAVAPQMRQRRSGYIINVSSVGGRVASPPMAAYAASKFALEALSEALAGEMKMFNVRVAIIEPRIIDTAMAHRIAGNRNKSQYPQSESFAAMFTEALQNPVPPSVVAAKILEIVQSETWQLRHPVGLDAVPFLQWRAQMTDEAWVDLQAGHDENRERGMQGDAGPETESKAG